jgi:hypothetical protein
LRRRAKNRPKRRLAESGQEMDFNFWRDLLRAERRIFMEVILHRAAALDRDFLAHPVAETLDHRALN